MADKKKKQAPRQNMEETADVSPLPAAVGFMRDAPPNYSPPAGLMEYINFANGANRFPYEPRNRPVMPPLYAGPIAPPRLGAPIPEDGLGQLSNEERTALVMEAARQAGVGQLSNEERAAAANTYVGMGPPRLPMPSPGQLSNEERAAASGVKLAPAMAGAGLQNALLAHYLQLAGVIR